MATNVVIDCDPGHDDAIALLLALQSPAISVEAITTVAGNQTLAKTTENALRILTLADRTDVPVAAGMAEPIIRDLTIAEHVHGDSGLDGPALPSPESTIVDREAGDVITEIARDREGITLISTGPLTNVGMLLKRHPDIEAVIDEIVLMGGAIAQGNYTPVAEFNMYVDPEAALLVFDADIPTTMIGLDVTRAAKVSADEFQRFSETGTEVGAVVADWLSFFLEFHRDEFGWDGVPIHDACAVAHVIDRNLIDTDPMSVVVETASEYADGQTICDVNGVTDRPANTEVGLAIDRDRFLDLLVDAVSEY